MFTRDFLCFSLCPLSLVLALDTTESSLASLFLHPPFTYGFILSMVVYYFAFITISCNVITEVSQRPDAFVSSESNRTNIRFCHISQTAVTGLPLPLQGLTYTEVSS